MAGAPCPAEWASSDVDNKGRLFLINNRQGRRRGRGGQRNPGGGNRQDNRQRGNAAQLLEKYKGLARDAQMAGDRVQAEYYLQYAEHYFRVLEEHRIRQDENQPQRHKGRRDEEDFDGDDDGDEEFGAADGDDEEVEQPRQQQRRDRSQDDGGRKPRRGRNNGPRRDEEAEDDGIALDALPPAIGDADEEKPKRRRRKSSDADNGAEAA